jgi:hypothetical protein
MYSLRAGFVKDVDGSENCLGLSTTADVRMETIARGAERLANGEE